MNRSDYADWTMDTIRFADTDKLGHVNNAAFSTFLETGRTHFLLDPVKPMGQPGTTFVIAKLILDFKAEMHWPGQAHIGTRCKSIGRSSFVLEQVILQGDTVAALAETVMVMFDETTRKSTPLLDITIARLKQMQVAL
ncbi:acyl-CoA thioesterase [Undibacter mobilis]|uniref:Acyl-CoA thioesterase n=1 Tax=Undibacter mobilis TaxID=2292256 RepID=A0A371B6Z0_9BRAD|nr:thioesterase family protein [Undibacter mobilis]RDV03213.1 acyl-CoA thioesterase [Undibacter mobilis]